MPHIHGDAVSYYKFDIGCFRHLFPETEYAASVKVVPSIHDLQSSMIDEVEFSGRVVISVGKNLPEETSVQINNHVYELQVICLL